MPQLSAQIALRLRSTCLNLKLPKCGQGPHLFIVLKRSFNSHLSWLTKCHYFEIFGNHILGEIMNMISDEFIMAAEAAVCLPEMMAALTISLK